MKKLNRPLTIWESRAILEWEKWAHNKYVRVFKLNKKLVAMRTVDGEWEVYEKTEKEGVCQKY